MKTLLFPFKLFAIVLCVGLLSVPAAMAGTYGLSCATSLTAGNTVVLSPFTPACPEPSGATLLAQESEAFSYTTTSGTTSGLINSAVFNDGGTLDFVYQVVNSPSSADLLARMTGSSFAGFMTGVAYTSMLPTALVGKSGWTSAPGEAPNTADTDNGSDIGFNFNVPPSNEIGPGENSEILIISTNATAYIPGNDSVIDSGTATEPGYQPTTSTVPEPATMAVLGLGLIGLGTLWRRRTNR
jgi:PEP-CTERM motif